MASEHKHFQRECRPVFMEYRFNFRRFGFWFLTNKNLLPDKNGNYSLYGVNRRNYIIWTNSNYWKTVSFWISQHDNMRNIIFQVRFTNLNKSKRCIEMEQILLSTNTNRIRLK